MTARIAASAAALCLLLAACEDGAPEPEGTRTKVRAANPVSDQLKGLSELYRYLGLRRAIVDSGQRCKKVDRGGYQEEYKSMAMWTAHCTDSGDWAVFIAPSGDVQVRRCGNLASLGLPLCKAQAPQPASAPASKAPSAQ
jgi:hypothetical protein